MIIKDTIIFQKALLQFHARLSRAFRSCGVTAKPRELSWHPSLVTQAGPLFSTALVNLVKS